MAKRIKGALTDEIISGLRAGDQILYSGTLYTARDAAHARIVELLESGDEVPFDLSGAIIYYAGPAPAKPGIPIGSVGPTSSYRMDPYAPKMLDAGVKAMIGKGVRSAQVIDSIVKNRCVYFAAIGGVAALMAQCVVSSELVAYEDLGTEAVRKLEVVDMPLTVAIDANGDSVYEAGRAGYLATVETGE